MRRYVCTATLIPHRYKHDLDSLCRTGMVTLAALTSAFFPFCSLPLVLYYVHAH